MPWFLGITGTLPITSSDLIITYDNNQGVQCRVLCRPSLGIGIPKILKLHFHPPVQFVKI